MSESANNVPTFNVGDNLIYTCGTYRGSGQVMRVKLIVIYTVTTKNTVNGTMRLSPGGMELMPPPPKKGSLSGDSEENYV